jgi:ABC-type branched-subunit amino acid transport system ATPase component
MAILLVETKVTVAPGNSGRPYVMARGRIVFGSRLDDPAADPLVRQDGRSCDVRNYASDLKMYQ